MMLPVVPGGLSGISEQQGFTLIELIIVIVLVGIIGVVSTRFITASVEGYVDSAARQRLANSGVIAAEKMSRSLRVALPNSVRLDTGCIEFIPTLAASDYVTVPIAAAANTFNAVGARLATDVTGRAVVYPISTGNLYNPGNNNSLTSATATFPAGTDEVTVTLTGAHQFLTDSPTRRFYIAGEPVAYCQQGSVLYRYSGYGFNPTVTLPPTGGTRDILVNRLVTNSLTFNYVPASLVRNAVVNFTFTLTDGENPYPIEQEANLRNVP